MIENAVYRFLTELWMVKITLTCREVKREQRNISEEKPGNNIMSGYWRIEGNYQSACSSAYRLRLQELRMRFDKSPTTADYRRLSTTKIQGFFSFEQGFMDSTMTAKIKNPQTMKAGKLMIMNTPVPLTPSPRYPVKQATVNTTKNRPSKMATASTPQGSSKEKNLDFLAIKAKKAVMLTNRKLGINQ
uniref:Uncharacterized protein n=1 Tax=Romanomermis culicivorax TaxID=13658 RepID=A0A915HP37_ROMCU